MSWKASLGKYAVWWCGLGVGGSRGKKAQTYSQGFNHKEPTKKARPGSLDSKLSWYHYVVIRVVSVGNSHYQRWWYGFTATRTAIGVVCVWEHYLRYGQQRSAKTTFTGYHLLSLQPEQGGGAGGGGGLREHKSFGRPVLLTSFAVSKCRTSMRSVRYPKKYIIYYLHMIELYDSYVYFCTGNNMVCLQKRYRVENQKGRQNMTNNNHMQGKEMGTRKTREMKKKKSRKRRGITELLKNRDKRTPPLVEVRSYHLLSDI